MTLLLAAPYGYPFGIAISLKIAAPALFKPDKLYDVVVEYGCPPVVADKVVASIVNCGRYDCRVQGLWIKHQYKQFNHAMKAIGISVELPE